MNQPPFDAELSTGIRRRVARVNPRPDEGRLLRELERRGARQRRVFAAAAAGVLTAGLAVGYAIGASGSPDTDVVAVRGRAPTTPPEQLDIEPSDVDAAVAEIGRAFQDAWAGSSTDEQHRDAVQGGDEIEHLRKRAAEVAQALGVTTEQIAGVTVEVVDTSFIDPAHAVVRFILTIPGRPSYLDKVGYAVHVDGRWKVSLRTACEILTLSGLGDPCPEPVRR